MMNERVGGAPIVIVEASARGDQMHTPEAVAALRRLHPLGGGIKRIAGELDYSAHMVRHSLRQGEWRPSRRPVRRRVLRGLEDGLAASFCQQRGTADVVRQALQRVHGLQVSLRTVERAVRPWRPLLEAEARATVRFETPPGRQLQIDFGTTTVRIGAEPAVVGGRDISWQVPVQVVSRDPALIEAFEAAGFQRGVKPGATALGGVEKLGPLLQILERP